MTQSLLENREFFTLAKNGDRKLRVAKKIVNFCLKLQVNGIRE
jgi:hypothetical protein